MAENVLIGTVTGAMTVLLAADDATVGTSIADPADTLVDPVDAAGVIQLGRSSKAYGSFSRNALKLRPFGTGSATNTFLMSVFAVERILGAPNGKPDQWDYALLASFTCTLSTKTGVAGGSVDASHLYCDTITMTVGNQGVDADVVSPTGNQGAHVVVDTQGAELVAVKFARNGSATACNTLVGTL